MSNFQVSTLGNGLGFDENVLRNIYEYSEEKEYVQLKMISKTIYEAGKMFMPRAMALRIADLVPKTISQLPEKHLNNIEVMSRALIRDPESYLKSGERLRKGINFVNLLELAILRGCCREDLSEKMPPVRLSTLMTNFFNMQIMGQIQFYIENNHSLLGLVAAPKHFLPFLGAVSGIQANQISYNVQENKNIDLKEAIEKAICIVAIKVLSNEPGLFSIASKLVRNNKEIARTVVEKDGDLLQFVGEDLKDDFDVVEAAYETKKSSLQFASDRIKKKFAKN